MNKKKIIVTCLSIIALTSSALGFAENRGGALTFRLADGYMFFAKKRGLENTSTPTIELGYEFDEKWGIQAGASIINTNIKNVTSNSSAHGTYYAIDGVYHFATYKNFIPYALAGIGVTSLKVSNTDDPRNQSNMNAGIGVEYFIADSIALGADARDVYTMVGGKNDIMLTAGVTFLFGGQTAASEPVAKPDFKDEKNKS